MKWNQTMLDELDDLAYYTRQIRKTANERIHLMPPAFMQQLAELEQRITELKRQTENGIETADFVTSD